MNRYEDQLYKEVEKTLKLLGFEYTNLWVEETPDMFTDTRIFLIYIETIDQTVYRIHFRQLMNDPITPQVDSALRFNIDENMNFCKLEFKDKNDYYEWVNCRNSIALLTEEEKERIKIQSQLTLQKYINELIIEMKGKGEL